MNRNEQVIASVCEAMQFIRAMWISKRFPVWSGDVHDFNANVIKGETTTYEVVRILTSISKGDHIEELQGLYVHTDSYGKIQRIDVREKSKGLAHKKPSKNRAKKN